MNSQPRHSNFWSIDGGDDLNRVEPCSRCKSMVEAPIPETCPHCHQPFECSGDRFSRLAAWALVIAAGFYIWQKIMVGL